MSREPDRRRAGRYVEALRGYLGLTREDLAERADLDRKTIFTLETGARWPQAKTRGAIEGVLGLEPGDLQRLAEGLEPKAQTKPASAALKLADARTAAAQLVERARVEAGLSVKGAASAAGISVREWERLVAASGLRTRAEVDAFAQMARAVGVDSGRLREAGSEAASELRMLELEAEHEGKTTNQLLDEVEARLRGDLDAVVEKHRPDLSPEKRRFVRQMIAALADLLASPDKDPSD